MPFSLADAFGLSQETAPQLVAFTGAGGKTSLMFGLAGTLPGKVIITTTTRMARAQIQQAAESLPAAVGRYPNIAPLRCTRISLLHGADVAENKVGGVDPAVPGRLLAEPDVSFVLVEADGARMLPIKAPAAHEPVIPPGTTLVVPVAGIDALGRSIAEAAHRPEIAAALLGKAPDSLLEAADIAALLTHPAGGLKQVPAAARVIPAINKVESAAQLQAARAAARAMLANARIEQVAITATEQPQPLVELQRRVRAVILAAGRSARMGRPKLLLPWGATTVLGQTISHVRQSAAFDSLVVSGADAAAVAAVAHEAGVPVLYNENFAAGEMLSSLQTAVAQLPPSTAAVLVVLGDQPLVEAQTIDQILAAFWRGEGDLVAPQHGGRRGNPVLIGRRYFAELLALPPGAAPRDLLRKHPLHLVPVPAEAVLLDIDETADYERLRPA